LKDFLQSRFPTGLTQTHYTRFMTTPKASLSSNFTDSEEEFKKVMDDRLKTIWWGEADDRLD